MLNISIIELGHFSLILAMLVAVAHIAVSILGALRYQSTWILFSSQAAIAQSILVAFSFGSLTYAFITSDFSVNLVYLNSHTDKPMIYKITGTWGNHEGSMLLWLLILTLFGGALALFKRKLRFSFCARVLTVQSCISLAFYLFILFTSNPFTRLILPPLNGQDLNPLLQDPGLAFHPPLLYLGYVGFSIAFSFSVAALIEGKVDSIWGHWIRPWVMASWGFLTIGIALGSWWAYYELGWGGWWFWDPVENASLMPWLSGTALLHSTILVKKRDTMKSWTVFLSILTFGLSLLGTFLVRSGILTSVHSFAVDPTRGIFILIMLATVVGLAFILFAWRGPKIRSTGMFQILSKEGSLLVNNLVMITACSSILLGTLYPIFLEAIVDKKISIGPPYFNTVFIPLMTPMVLIMAIGPLLSWRRTDLNLIINRLWFTFILTGFMAIIILALVTNKSILGMLGLFVSAWLTSGVLVKLAEQFRFFSKPFGQVRQRTFYLKKIPWGMTLGHFGLAVTIAGISGVSGWKEEAIQSMLPGEQVKVGGYNYTFHGVTHGAGPNYSLVQGKFVVTKDNKYITTLKPENRIYNQHSIPTTEAAIHTLFFGDLYVVLGDQDTSDGSYLTRVYWNPLVAWIWIGALIMAIGAIIGIGRTKLPISVKQKNTCLQERS